ncbi:MAG: T9SS type A sorting domain-containing protein [Chitinophagaceae bacterium]
MKNWIICLVLINSFSLSAQEYKRGNVWSVGFFPVVLFDFKNSLAIDQVVHSFNPPPFCIQHSGSCISDTNGNLALISNAHNVYDGGGYIIENGEKLNCKANDTIFAHHEGYIGSYTQMTLILPKKGNQYYVFGVGMSDSVATNYANHTYTEFDVLNYSIVDMDSNGGKGKVIEKNILLAENQHYVNCAMQAVRHGNGKDWWLCKADCEEHRFQLYLVKEDTIEGPFYQYVPPSDTVDYCWFSSQLYFSEDGTRMACSMYGNRENGVYISPNRVDLFDFDRCTGALSYRNHYEVPYDTTTYPNNDMKFGICFSPDGKLVYMSTIYSIYQIDVEDTNRYNAMYITGPDTFFNNFPWYNEMKIAPDGRIYVGTVGVYRPYMSYIANPNIRGLGCQFTPNGIWQPYANLSDPPNMPNYALGEDSLHCWPVSTSNLSAPQGELLVYPNPAHTWLSIACMLQEGESAQFELYDMVGNKKLEKTLTRDENTRHINISKMPKGVYIYTCKQAGHKTASGKLIIE